VQIGDYLKLGHFSFHFILPFPWRVPAKMQNICVKNLLPVECIFRAVSNAIRHV